ncbi:uncharacterized protein MELLADRAFT_73843 [Melampsora larici-populina 98AG31]|uniref:Uncharacterized protein n=1 Tax=Melampsora larici-populina (strain 98AG31 / pathotype 3-4-7) TaxID=747676 RepID=F4R414_MELLP|nr:uncharacterized protein MELLADRAFT_73843 [Melampsora larici-populina 98AG31]EGG12720.1 hypothetical protein MELLADRAFT_73843 [Melampsora larici-populina 98AG31]
MIHDKKVSLKKNRISSRFIIFTIVLFGGLVILCTQWRLQQKWSFDSNKSVSSITISKFIQESNCPKTLSYRMGKKHGFGSEFSLYLRIAAIAFKLNYTLIVEDSDWNYGRLEDYFNKTTATLNYSNSCFKESDNFQINPELEKSIWPASWINNKHVYLPREIDYIDQLFLALFVDQSQLSEMHQEERKNSKRNELLSAYGTLPTTFEQAFLAQVEVMNRIWIPRNELAQEIKEGEEALEELRVNQSTVIIGLHLRLGDKVHELSNYKVGMTIELKADQGQLRSRDNEPPSTNKLADACFDAAESLLSQIRQTSNSTLQSLPILIVMSDDPDGIELIQSVERSKQWKIMTVSSLLDKSSDLSKFQDLHQSSFSTKLKRHSSKSFHRVGFHESVFNQLPLSKRITQTRKFIIELTLLGRLSDGIIFTGSSNVSKLFGLLGNEKRLMERTMRSLDVRWHPTARYTR